MAERSAAIEIGGKKYELLLTTKATKEISEKFGGLEKIGDALKDAKDVNDALSIVVWLIVLLANQTILRNNLLTGSKEPTLTEEAVELLTSPADLNTYDKAIMECLVRGTKRTVESEEDPKNTEGE